MRCFFSHHKCATTYLAVSVLQPICDRLGWRTEIVYSPDQFDCDLDAFTRASGCDLLSYINAETRYVDQLERPFRAVHVIRDPRDILVSAYFSHRWSHPTEPWPELAAHRERLAALDEKRGLLAEIEFISRLPTNGHDLRPFHNLMRWDDADPRILELRYEDMVAEPATFFAAFFDQLGLLAAAEDQGLGGGDAGVADLLRMAGNVSFATLSGGRDRGEEDPRHHYRKGEPGDWRNHFDADVAAAFDAAFLGLVSRLGYAPSAAG